MHMDRIPDIGRSTSTNPNPNAAGHTMTMTVKQCETSIYSTSELFKPLTQYNHQTNDSTKNPSITIQIQNLPKPPGTSINNLKFKTKTCWPCGSRLFLQSPLRSSGRLARSCGKVHMTCLGWWKVLQEYTRVLLWTPFVSKQKWKADMGVYIEKVQIVLVGNWSRFVCYCLPILPANLLGDISQKNEGLSKSLSPVFFLRPPKHNCSCFLTQGLQLTKKRGAPNKHNHKKMYGLDVEHVQHCCLQPCQCQK